MDIFGSPKRPKNAPRVKIVLKTSIAEIEPLRGFWAPM